jgi:hypothetical protein
MIASAGYLAMLGYLIFVFVSGRWHEPVRQILSFLKGDLIAHQKFSFNSLPLLMDFVFVDFALCFLAIVVLVVIFRRLPRVEFIKFKNLLTLPPWWLLFWVLGIVAAEEIVFRWFPLVIIASLLHGGIAFWGVFYASAGLFALVHILNQKPEARNRNIFFALPQFLGGIVLGYIFLSFGFGAALFVHFVFDLILLLPINLAYHMEGEEILEKYVNDD